ncbi:MAG: hypothetical protein WBC05_19775 [Sedimentisphaerales bacterium]
MTFVIDYPFDFAQDRFAIDYLDCWFVSLIIRISNPFDAAQGKPPPYDIGWNLIRVAPELAWFFP